MANRALRLAGSLTGVALITFVGYRLVPINATTQGFAYLLFVLVLASTWGFLEASFASVAATLTFNFFFFEPIGTFTVEDPRNWVALFSFLATSLIASRLSTEARQRAFEAFARQQDLERLYTFSRAILLIDNSEPFPRQIVRKLADVFELGSAVLYDRRSEEFHRAGPLEFDGLDEQLRDAARDVVDLTGLQGAYDFKLSWVGRQTIDLVGGLTLPAALEKQLGLKLERRNLPVPVIVIDHVEKATEN